MAWEVETTEVFDAWWQTLTEQEQDDATAVIELLSERGPRLPFPYSSGIEGSKFSHMRELRIQSHGDPVRVFYAFDPRRVTVLLVGGIKTGGNRRFYREHVRKADALYASHLRSLEE